MLVNARKVTQTHRHFSLNRSSAKIHFFCDANILFIISEFKPSSPSSLLCAHFYVVLLMNKKKHTQFVCINVLVVWLLGYLQLLFLLPLFFSLFILFHTIITIYPSLLVSFAGLEITTEN